MGSQDLSASLYNSKHSREEEQQREQQTFAPARSGPRGTSKREGTGRWESAWMCSNISCTRISAYTRNSSSLLLLTGPPFDFASFRIFLLCSRTFFCICRRATSFSASLFLQQGGDKPLNGFKLLILVQYLG